MRLLASSLSLCSHFQRLKNHLGLTSDDKSEDSHIARARQMVGIYGVDAKVPCAYCRAQGEICRIYHPIMYTANWRVVNGRWKNHEVACACCTVSRGTSHNKTGPCTAR
jgi:hypothetical protein